MFVPAAMCEGAERTTGAGLDAADGVVLMHLQRTGDCRGGGLACLPHRGSGTVAGGGVPGGGGT